MTIARKLNRQSRLMQDFLKDFARLVADGGSDNLETRAEKSLQQYGVRTSEALDKTRVMIRLGPMLGLMGTLIPMGPALLALTKGDLTQIGQWVDHRFRHHGVGS